MTNAWLHLRLAAQGLMRNRVQAALAVLGMMVGVAALVTGLALGRGAQEALNDQLRAAGANLLVVTAGNYKVKTVDPNAQIGHGIVLAPQAPAPPGRDGALLFKASWSPARRFEIDAFDDASARLMPIHFEDDPMAVHDHPTAAQRLGDASAGLGSAATLTRDDAKAIAKIPGVRFVVSGVHENERIFVENDPNSKQWFTRMHGTEADLPEIRTGWTMLYGRFLTKENVEKNEQVAVLGKVVADHLFGEGVNPVGRSIYLWHQRFKVVGVVGSRSWVVQPTAGDDQFDAFYVPVSTIDHLLNVSKLNNIAVTTVSVGETDKVAKAITDLLRQRHKITEATPDDFTVTSVAQQVLGKGLPPELARVVSGNMKGVDQMTVASLSASLQRTNWTIVALLAGVAGVSLLVGGIGVMNLLLFSVTQRTREVGLRIALGARHSDIAAQFLLEAVLLSVIGGLLGIVCGVAASGGLAKFFQWSAVVSPLAAALAVAVAAILGIVFGVYPAQRAARLNPIEALRYE